MPVPLTLLIISLSLLLISVLLLRTALFPKRTGTDVYCRRCHYLLAGLTSANCPECGTFISPQETIVGTRQRKPVRLLIAIPLLMVSLTLMIPRTARLVASFNWRQTVPAWYLLGDARTPFAPGAPDAFNELTRRATTGGLSAAHTRELVTLLLSRHAKRLGHLDHIYSPNLLTRLYHAGVLTLTERQQFLRQSVVTSLRIRQPVVAGDPLPFQVDQALTASRFWGDVRAVVWRIDDGTPVPVPSVPHTADSAPTGFAHPTTAGPHTLAITVIADVYDGPFRDAGRSKLVHTERRTLSAEFAVLPSAPPNYLQPLHAPELAGAIKESISVTASVDARRTLHAQVSISRPPAPVAFDVYLVKDSGSEDRLGSVLCDRAEYAWFVLRSDRLANPPTSPLRIILRPSRNVARLSLDLTEYWDGVITYDDILDRDPY